MHFTSNITVANSTHRLNSALISNTCNILVTKFSLIALDVYIIPVVGTKLQAALCALNAV